MRGWGAGRHADSVLNRNKSCWVLTSLLMDPRHCFTSTSGTGSGYQVLQSGPEPRSGTGTWSLFEPRREKSCKTRGAATELGSVRLRSAQRLASFILKGGVCHAHMRWNVPVTSLIQAAVQQLSRYHGYGWW